MTKRGQTIVDLVDFVNRYYEPMNRVICDRMHHLGVPEEMVGFKYPGIDEGPFVRHPQFQIGGNVNPYQFPGRKPGINLDYGVLDADHPAMIKVSAWAKATLRDRIDAAIAHEYTEALAMPMPGFDFHEQALKFALDTRLDISLGARRILSNYRTAMGFD